MSKEKSPTQFELDLAAYNEGKLKLASVSMGNASIHPMGYRLAVHKRDMKVFAMGMKMRGNTLKGLKGYYGLKSRSAKDCLVEFEVIYSDFKKSIGIE
jgi:hypothetical protein